MNYRRLYCKIIANAKSQNRQKHKGIYYEEHHILPKSLFPVWKNRKSNKVLLTAREHFFCHQLLEKIYPNSNLFLALWFLANDGQNKYCSSREYQKLKERYYMSETHKENSIAATKAYWNDPEKRAKAIKKIKDARAKQTNLAYGKRSDESRKNISEGTKRAMKDPELRKMLSEKSRAWSDKNKDVLIAAGKKAGKKTKLIAEKYKLYKAQGGNLSWNEFQKRPC